MRYKPRTTVQTRLRRMEAKALMVKCLVYKEHLSIREVAELFGFASTRYVRELFHYTRGR